LTKQKKRYKGIVFISQFKLFKGPFFPLRRQDLGSKNGQIYLMDRGGIKRVRKSTFFAFCTLTIPSQKKKEEMKVKLSMLSSRYCHFEHVLAVATFLHGKMGKHMAVTVTDWDKFYPQQSAHYCTYLTRCQRTGGTLQRANKHEEKLIED